MKNAGSTNQLKLDGIPGTSGRLSDMKNCQSKEMRFVKCNLIQNNIPANGYRGTAVIVDDGLSLLAWRELEENFVDIVRYVTTDPSTGEIKEFGSEGKDCEKIVTVSKGRLIPCPLLPYRGYLSRNDNTHGAMVTSAFGTIARNAKIIFVDLRLGDALGFKYSTQFSKMLEWLNNAVVPYHIKVLSMSFSGPNPGNNTQVKNLITSLYLNGVFQVTSIGNEGIFAGNRFPQNHRYVYAVGSVDHESRGFPWDGDYFSSYGKFTGDVAYYKNHDCSSVLTTFCSSFGDSSFGDKSTDFVMPGNGVLTAQFHAGVYVAKYSMGTSFSTPYLAAAALIAQYAYFSGHQRNYGRGDYLSPSELYDVLKVSSSRSTWDPYLGWGYIDLDYLYDYAWSLSGE